MIRIFSLFSIVLFSSTTAFSHNHEPTDLLQETEETAMPADEMLVVPSEEIKLPDNVQVQDLGNDIYMISVEGSGNIAVSSGVQGLFVIDNGLAEKNADVMSAIKSISDAPIKILTNTHWHYDHTGNNKAFANSDAVIIAHDNVRKRLKNGQTIAAFDKVIEPSHLDALPILTFEKSMTVHLNDHKAQIAYMDPAHTDGDSFVIWPELNIIHTGDLFFNGIYPFIDSSSGGSLRGMIAASKKLLSGVNEETKIIPGHGPLATKADLQAFHDMLDEVEIRLARAKKSETTIEEWIAANPLEDLAKEWEGGPFDTAAFTKFIWDAH